MVQSYAIFKITRLNLHMSAEALGIQLLKEVEVERLDDVGRGESLEDQMLTNISALTLSTSKRTIARTIRYKH